MADTGTLTFDSGDRVNLSHEELLQGPTPLLEFIEKPSRRKKALMSPSQRKNLTGTKMFQAYRGE